jgi:phosphatidylinositol-3,4,5-trisphosphate 3-phosphatase/dual-specificity protein phosphatase PTEN
MSSNPIKSRVFTHNNRLDVEGYKSLDLTYITDNVIAMSYPASDVLEKIYRNNIKKVKQFLDERHKNNYFIYNLSNRPYDNKKFDHNVDDTFQWQDHHSPALSLLFQVCRKMFDYVLQDITLKAVVVHCNAGKGRTGSCISCYLMYTGLADNYIDALTFYGRQRFSNGRGVTQPSQ